MRINDLPNKSEYPDINMDLSFHSGCVYIHLHVHTHIHRAKGVRMTAGIKSDVSAALHASPLFLSLWRHALRHHAIAPSSATFSLSPSFQLSLVTGSACCLLPLFPFLSRSLTHRRTCSLTHFLYALVLFPEPLFIEAYLCKMEQRLPPATGQAFLERNTCQKQLSPSWHLLFFLSSSSCTIYSSSSGQFWVFGFPSLCTWIFLFSLSLSVVCIIWHELSCV